MSEPTHRKRLVILHAPGMARGARHHMVVLIADRLRDLGVEVIDVYATNRLVKADAIFVHVDLSVVPQSATKFAEQYPAQINAYARDIRKSMLGDGLLGANSDYPYPVIVKSDLNYGGEPERMDRSLLAIARRRLQRLQPGAPAPAILTKADYRIFPTLGAVPGAYFSRDTIVQKLVLEKDSGKNLLREYIFLGDLHYENIERSAGEIITEDEHVSCLPFTPHPRLLALRRRLGLDYGKIDYVMQDGEPFIFDANKTLGLGALANTDRFGDDVRLMLEAFAWEVFLMLSEPDTRFRQLPAKRSA